MLPYFYGPIFKHLGLDAKLVNEKLSELQTLLKQIPHFAKVEIDAQLDTILRHVPMALENPNAKVPSFSDIDKVIEAYKENGHFPLTHTFKDSVKSLVMNVNFSVNATELEKRMIQSLGASILLTADPKRVWDTLVKFEETLETNAFHTLHEVGKDLAGYKDHLMHALTDNALMSLETAEHLYDRLAEDGSHLLAKIV